MDSPPSGLGLLGRFHAQLDEGETSDCTFGLVVGTAFVALGLLPLIRHHSARTWMWSLGLAILIAAAASPQILRMPKRAWLFLGFLLGQIVNPIVLGVLFFLVITPAGWLMRLFGSDPMRRRFDQGMSTYWQIRAEPASDMNDQF